MPEQPEIYTEAYLREIIQEHTDAMLRWVDAARKERDELAKRVQALLITIGKMGEEAKAITAERDELRAALHDAASALMPFAWLAHYCHQTQFIDVLETRANGVGGFFTRKNFEDCASALARVTSLLDGKAVL